MARNDVAQDTGASSSHPEDAPREASVRSPREGPEHEPSSWRDLPDPDPVRRDLGPETHKRTDRTSVLDVGSADPRQQQQGELNDCFIVATVASCLAAAPDRLADVLEAHDDGTVTVHLHEATFNGKHMEPTGRRMPRRVDRDLYERGGKRIYGATWHDPAAIPHHDRLELPLIEKALAGESYDVLDAPQSPARIITELLGVPAAQLPLDTLFDSMQYDADKLGIFLTLVFAVQQAPVVFGTGDDDDEMAARGLAPGHAYAMIGLRTDDDGRGLVTLMEPRRKLEPGDDGQEDGVFEVSVADLPHMFVAVAYVMPV